MVELDIEKQLTTPVKVGQEVEMTSSLLEVATPGTVRNEQESGIEVKFEFKITGMTCVACSGSIERLIVRNWLIMSSPVKGYSTEMWDCSLTRCS